MPTELEDCYRLLKLQPGASPSEVKKAYRKLAKYWHPDRFARDPVMSAKSQEMMKQVNLAYEEICKHGPSSPRPGNVSSANPDPRGTPPQSNPPPANATSGGGWSANADASQQEEPPMADGDDEQHSQPTWRMGILVVIIPFLLAILVSKIISANLDSKSPAPADNASPASAAAPPSSTAIDFDDDPDTQPQNNPAVAVGLPPKPETPKDNGPVAPPPVVASVSEGEKLNQVVAKINATGILVLGKDRILQTDYGPHRVGDVFDVTFLDVKTPSKIVLVAIGDHSYSLKLNGTVLANIALAPAAHRQSSR